MKRLYIHTMGCQMNLYDSERIESILFPVGYDRTDKMEDADLVVLNTCSVRQKAEQKAFSFLGRLRSLKKSRPGLIIAVGGCTAQHMGAGIMERMPQVDLVFGTGAIERLPELVRDFEEKRIKTVDTGISSSSDISPGIRTAGRDLKVSRFVTIMRGCDNFCTYCVVPHVRGRETSRAPEAIVSEIKGMVDSGTREVTLLGQNVNSYGKKDGFCSFPALIERVSKIEGLLRIRFTTSHPKDLSCELVDAFASVDKLCNHIHLPVQSGSDEVLRRMNRRYTSESYIEKIAGLREKCPDIAVSTDIIVGFPGETESDFEKTLMLVKRVDFDSLFAFIYSDRPLTTAAKMDNKLPEEVKAERLKRLLKLQEEITLKKHVSMVGSVQEILVEGLSRRNRSGGDENGSNAQYTGRTPENKIVHFAIKRHNPGPDPVGRLALIRIREAYAHSLWGELVSIH